MSELRKLTLSQYLELHASLCALPGSERITSMRHVVRNDLFYLLRFAINRPDMHHPWILDRCWEVQESPNSHLDLWAREHYKSTIITYGLTIQDILSSHGENPDPKWKGLEPTFGIFSHTRPIAKKFLRQIKLEFEQNKLLFELFPDVIWEKPDQEAPVWSMDDGIILKRKTNPKEATVEAWGLVDSQPTGAHFHTRVYDDVVTRTSVNTPDAIKKTTDAWELSLNLAQRGGTERYIGTRYHFNDTYSVLMARQAVADVRTYAATVDGTPTGKPVLLDRTELESKRRKMGSFTFACQMLQNPKADEIQGFSIEDIRRYHYADTRNMNIYILVDPAHGKKKENDYTALMVIGLGDDHNYYLLDAVRDRLNLTQRGRLVMDKHREWRPVALGYERYGLQADVEYIYDLQEKENYRFEVVELGGILGNEDRVRRLIPTHEEHRWFYPHSIPYVDYEGKTVDLMDIYLKEEFIPFPVGVHVDMMDAASRIEDDALKAVFPKISGRPRRETDLGIGTYRRRPPGVHQPVEQNLSWIT